MRWLVGAAAKGVIDGIQRTAGGSATAGVRAVNSRQPPVLRFCATPRSTTRAFTALHSYLIDVVEV